MVDDPARASPAGLPTPFRTLTFDTLTFDVPLLRAERPPTDPRAVSEVAGP